MKDIAKIKLTPGQAYALAERVGGKHPATEAFSRYNIKSIERLIVLGLLENRGSANVRRDVENAVPTADGRKWFAATR